MKPVPAIYDIKRKVIEIKENSFVGKPFGFSGYRQYISYELVYSPDETGILVQGIGEKGAVLEMLLADFETGLELDGERRLRLEVPWYRPFSSKKLAEMVQHFNKVKTEAEHRNISKQFGSIKGIIMSYMVDEGTVRVKGKPKYKYYVPRLFAGESMGHGVPSEISLIR